MSDVQKMAIAAIKLDDRARRDFGDIEALAQSIKQDGLLHVPVVTKDGVLVAGRRRIEAMRLLGFTEVPVRILDPADLRRAEAAENGLRKSLAPSEMYELAVALVDIERAGAKERQGTRTDAGQSGDFGRARDRVGKYLGISGRSVAKLLELGDAAQRGPAWKAFLDEADALGTLDGPYRKLREFEEQPPPAAAAPSSAPSAPPAAIIALPEPTSWVPPPPTVQDLRAHIAELEDRIVALELTVYECEEEAK